MRIVVAALALLVPGGALAQVQVSATTINTCRQILAVADRPAARAATVPGAAYVPSVDARGNAVAPADLNPALQVPDEIVLPVAPEVFTFNGRTPPRGFPDLRANLGEFRLRLGDGRITFNGQPLSPTSDVALVQACRDLLSREAVQQVPR